MRAIRALSALARTHLLRSRCVRPPWQGHCISSWGQPDFRSQFRKLGELRDHVPGVPFIALTATATPAVRADMSEVLRLNAPLLSIESIYRPELFLVREPRLGDFKQVTAHVARTIAAHGTPAIV